MGDMTGFNNYHTAQQAVEGCLLDYYTVLNLKPASVALSRIYNDVKRMCEFEGCVEAANIRLVMEANGWSLPPKATDDDVEHGWSDMILTLVGRQQGMDANEERYEAKKQATWVKFKQENGL